MWKRYIYIVGGILLAICVVGIIVCFFCGDCLVVIDDNDWNEAISGDRIEEEMYFNDVSENDEFSEYILYVTERNLMFGDDKGNFNPNKFVSIGDFFEIIAKASMPRKDFKTFSGEDFLKFFIELEVLEEEDAKRYDFGSNIKKSDLAILLAKVDMKIRNMEQIMNGFYFRDLKSLSDVEQTLINHSVGRGFFSITGDNFNPNQFIRRADLAKIIYLFINM